MVLVDMVLVPVAVPIQITGIVVFITVMVEMLLALVGVVDPDHRRGAVRWSPCRAGRSFWRWRG
jgi:hypothetical protein